MRYGVGRSFALDLIICRDAGLKLPCFEFLFSEINFVALLVMRNLFGTCQMPHTTFGYIEQ